MPYTTAQLTSMFSNVHVGVAPNAAQTALLEQVAQLSRTGQISDAQAQYYIVNTADADTSVALLSYQFFTGRTPTQAGLSFLVNSTTNTTDLNDAYYQNFNLENRYINFAQNLGIVGEGRANFVATYGALTFAQTVQTAYEQIVGSTYATAAGLNPVAAIADITSRQGYFQQVAAERMAGQNQDLAVKAAVVGYIMAEAMKADVGIYAAGANNFLFDLAPDNLAQYNNDLATNYGLQTGGLSPAGHVIALTSSFDTPGGSPPAVNTQGGAGADVYIADNTSLTTDSINGGGGADRLIYTNTSAGASTLTPSLQLVEQIELSASKGGAVTLDLGQSTGVNTVIVQGGATGQGPNDVGGGTVSIINATNGVALTVDVDDSATANSVSFALKTDGKADSLGLTLRNTDTGGKATTQGLQTLTANGVETLLIATSRATIPATTVDASDTISIGNLVATSATQLTLSGETAISLNSAAANLGFLQSIDAAAMTKDITLGTTTTAFGHAGGGVDVTTGSGNDLVSLSVGNTPSLKSVSLGSGTDTLVLAGGGSGGLTIVNLAAADQVSQVVNTANLALQTGIENIDLRGMFGNAEITGTAGVNTIVATGGADTITAGAGADIIDVGAGFDTLVMAAAGQTGSGISANGVVTGGDIVTGMGAGDRVDLRALGVGALTGASATQGSAYLSGGSGTVALIEGNYDRTTGAFTAGGGGPDLLFEYDTNGAVAGGTEAIVLLASNASINSVSSDAFGMFTFA